MHNRVTEFEGTVFGKLAPSMLFCVFLPLKELCHAKLTFTRGKYTSNGNFFTFIIFFKVPPEGGQRSQQAFIWVLAGEA